jgi:hypothetical protein
MLGLGQWDDYAKRTADSAYTPRADRQLESLASKYAEQWARLEGRELQSVIAARVVRLDLTEEQFKRLGKTENVHDAAFRAMVEDRKFEFMDLEVFRKAESFLANLFQFLLRSDTAFLRGQFMIRPRRCGIP